MVITLPVLSDRFNRFNQEIFGGKLPRIALRVGSATTRAGSFSHRTVYGIRGATHQRTITVSSAFDLSPDKLEDVIIHEMIHYWIDLYGPKEAPHGPAFIAMADDINRRFGRHITVRVKATATARKKYFIVCVATLSDGRMGVTVVARTRIREMSRAIPKLFATKECRWYVTSNAYFSHFPAALKPKIYVVADKAKLIEALNDTTYEISVADGNISLL
jgi:predicted SprT family Zn-dependent metalloprotease